MGEEKPEKEKLSEKSWERNNLLAQSHPSPEGGEKAIGSSWSQSRVSLHRTWLTIVKKIWRMCSSAPFASACQGVICINAKMADISSARHATTNFLVSSAQHAGAICLAHPYGIGLQNRQYR